MMSEHHFKALSALADGARYNILHSIARELIRLGLAREEFGRLTITEAGRLAISPRHGIHVISEHVTDLNFGCQLSGDPMSNPQAEPFELLPPLPQEAEAPRPQEVALEAPMPLPAPPEPARPPTSDRRELALRAAGVASGKTGVWVDEKWVVEFITALDAAG